MYILIAYLFAILTAVGRKKDDSQHVNNETNKDSKPFPVPLPVINMPVAPSDEERAKQEKKDRRDKWKFRFEVAGLVVLSIYAGFTAVTYFQIKESATAATEQFRADQRAWLALSVSSEKPKVGENMPVMVEMVNNGKTPAIDVRLCGLADYASDLNGFPPFRDYGPKDCTPTMLLPPVGTAVLPLIIYSDDPSRGFGKSEVEALTSGRIFVRLYGKVSYSDIFGCRHWMDYCHRRVVISGGQVGWISCKNGNAIDLEPRCMK
jgi:hypothetical protein